MLQQAVVPVLRAVKCICSICEKLAVNIVCAKFLAFFNTVGLRYLEVGPSHIKSFICVLVASAYLMATLL